MITLNEEKVLIALLTATSPSECTASAIAARAGLDPSNAQRIIDQSLKSGLIELIHVRPEQRMLLLGRTVGRPPEYYYRLISPRSRAVKALTEARAAHLARVAAIDEALKRAKR
jgi:hypothetical protein